MQLITIESEAWQQIIAKLDAIQSRIKSNDRPLSEKWLDNQDVCQLLYISKRTLQHYRDTEVIPYSQIGSKIYYKASDIENHLNRNYKSKHQSK